MSAADPLWQIVSEQIEPTPLPFQAAVFRRSVQNRSTRIVTAPYPEEGAIVRGFKGPDEEEFQPVEGEVLAGEPLSSNAPLAGAKGPEPLNLPPEHECTISLTMAGVWLFEDDCAPLFYEPGRFEVRFETGEPLTITVAAPQSDDKLIRDILAADPPLAAAMLSPTLYLLPAGARNKMQRIVSLYPASSYADYARFGLARFYSKTDRRKALEVSKEINPKKFAYGASVLVLRKSLERSLAPAGNGATSDYIAKQLRESFTESYDYLEDLKSRLSEEEWIKQNPRAPNAIRAK